MSQSKVHDVARAIADRLLAEGWDGLGDRAKGVYRDAARVAIEAMRVPNEAMLATQGKSRPDLAATEVRAEVAEHLNRSVRLTAATIWGEMIDGALK